MGNKQSKNNNIKSKNKGRKPKKKWRSKSASSIFNNETHSASSATLAINKDRRQSQYTYAEVLKLIEDELLHYVPIDLSGLILSFIPRSTIGDESNPINPYDVLNVHVHLVSPHTKIPARILSIFNLITPNCHCGAVLSHMQYEETQSPLMECGRCQKPIGINKMVTSCYNPYFKCLKHNTGETYNICSSCIYANLEIYQYNDGELFNESYASNSFSMLKTQRRVCLAFTEDYVRVYLHCFKNPTNEDQYQYATEHWRMKSNLYSLNDTQIGILLDDFSDTNWDKRGKYWTDCMEVWTGGGSGSIYTTLCHCNQINHKVSNESREKIEKYLLHKQTQKHSNVHDKKGTRKPWSGMFPKLFHCSVTEDEDTITAILDIVGGFLSNLSDEQKLQLTYRGKFNKPNTA